MWDDKIKNFISIFCCFFYLCLSDFTCSCMLSQKQLATHQKAIFENANAVQSKYDQRRKTAFDQHRKQQQFEIGEHLTVYVGENKVGKKRKFSPKWYGLWQIIKKYGNNAVFIREIATGEERKQTFQNWNEFIGTWTKQYNFIHVNLRGAYVVVKMKDQQNHILTRTCCPWDMIP